MTGIPARSVGAGWSSPVAHQAHNLKVAGSNPAPATNPNFRKHWNFQAPAELRMVLSLPGSPELPRSSALAQRAGAAFVGLAPHAERQISKGWVLVNMILSSNIEAA